MLANPDAKFRSGVAAVAEGLAGLAFIAIGAASLMHGSAFLTPVLGVGSLGELVSAGAFPLIYAAIGIKVGVELAGLMTKVSGMGSSS
jgi:multicomponent Na+:H+ antiporter subunit B